MSQKRYVVRLSEDERAMLQTLVKAKRVGAQKRARAQVLLKVDEGDDGAAWTDGAAAVERPPRARPPRARRLTPAGEQELLAVAQSAPPAGRARWTLHLLADRLVQLQVVNAISHETVRQALKKTTCNRTSKSAG